MKKHVFLCLMAIAFLGLQGMGQPAYLEGNWTGTWSSGNALTNRGVVYATRVQATATNANTPFLFNNANQDYNPKWVGSNSNFTRTTNTLYAGGAYYFTSGSWDHNLEISATANNYYTFIIGQNSGSNNDLSILETTYNPTLITGVSQSPLTVHNGEVVTITVTVNNTTLNSGEYLFVRWTNDAWATSSFTSAITISSGSGTATIPAQGGGVTVQYYALTTNQASPVTSTVDYYTLDIDNGVNNANYAYTTTAWLLPITLQSFTAQKQNEVSVLNWTTANEENAAQFDIERSVNGQNFSTIATVMAGGNSNTLHTYHFTDLKPETGLNYYRLKMLDQDGHFEYSKIILLDFDAVRPVISLSPNPGQNLVHLYTGQKTGNIMIFNSLGDLVKLIPSTGSKDGNYDIDTQDLPDGIYQVVAIFDNGQRANTEMVLSR